MKRTSADILVENYLISGEDRNTIQIYTSECLRMLKISKSFSLLSLSFAIFCVCCGTQPVRFEDAKAIEPARQIKFQKKQSENDALLIVIRDKGFSGGGCGVQISVNHELAGTIKPAEKLEMWLPPREHFLTAELVGCLDGTKANYDLNLKPKQRKLLRLPMPPGFQPILE